MKKKLLIMCTAFLLCSGFMIACSSKQPTLDQTTSDQTTIDQTTIEEHEAAKSNQESSESKESDTTSLEETSESQEGAGDDSGFTKFTTLDIYKNEVNQDIFKDYDLTMINIWGTFCGPCLKEMPDLAEIHNEYKEKGFQVVGVVMDVYNSDGTLSVSQVDTAVEIAEKTGANYTHLLPSVELINGKLKDVTAIPETIFVDQEGNLVGKSYLGAKSKNDWIEIIDSLLAE